MGDIDRCPYFKSWKIDTKALKCGAYGTIRCRFKCGWNPETPRGKELLELRKNKPIRRT